MKLQPTPRLPPALKLRRTRRRTSRGKWVIGVVVLGAVIATVICVIVLVFPLPSPWADKRDETVHTQGIVMRAFAAYHKNSGDYPDESDSATLMVTLMSDKDASRILHELSRDAWEGPGKPLLDAYRAEMRYKATAGLGGGPLLISAGADRDFGDHDWTRTSDNIRSDGK